MDVQLLQPQIEEIVREFAPPQCQVLLVDSVQAWAKAADINEADPFRAAMAVTRRHDGAPSIVMLKEISPDIQQSVIGALEFRGFGDETPQLDDPLVFLEHLTLHEIAHLVLDTDSEPACDRWAFDRLTRRIRATRDGAV